METKAVFWKNTNFLRRKSKNIWFIEKCFKTPPKHWTTDATASWQFGILRKDPSTKSQTHETGTKFRIFILIFIQLIPKKKTELYGNHLFRVTSYWHLMQSKNLQHPNIFDSKCQKKRDEEIIIVIVYSKMNHFTRMDWVSMATN